MHSEKITTPFHPSIVGLARPRTLSEGTSRVKVDGVDRREEGVRSAADAMVTTGFRRPTESHWEWIIDRATD